MGTDVDGASAAVLHKTHPAQLGSTRVHPFIHPQPDDAWRRQKLYTATVSPAAALPLLTLYRQVQCAPAHAHKRI